MLNLLTIDVEEWFQTTALDPYIGMAQWSSQRSRVVPQVRRLLEILADHQTRATFFILGWLAARHPELVREISAAGHEIASHGYRHRLIYQLTPRQFQDYLERAKKVLEDLESRISKIKKQNEEVLEELLKIKEQESSVRKRVEKKEKKKKDKERKDKREERKKEKQKELKKSLKTKPKKLKKPVKKKVAKKIVKKRK